MMAPRSQPKNSTPTAGTRFAAIKANDDVLGALGASGTLGALGALGARGALGAIGALGALGARGALGLSAVAVCEVGAQVDAIAALGAGGLEENRVTAVMASTMGCPSSRGIALPREDA